MKSPSTHARASRAVIGLAAAYAVALQMLLGGVLGAQADAAGAPPDAFVICLGAAAQDDTGHSDTPAPDPDLCARLCGQAACSAADLPPVFSTAFVLTNRRAAIESADPSPLRLAPQPSPKRAQGPPKIL